MANWNDFIKAIRLDDDLNSPSSIKEILDIEVLLGFNLPDELKNIYLNNNGQIGKKKGLFKAVSGYDVYRRPLFLSLKEMYLIWKKLCEDKDMRDYFSFTFIPFASDNKDYPDNVFCLDVETSRVFLLWALAPDPTLPVDWQLTRIKQADSFAQFLDNQILLSSIR